MKVVFCTPSVSGPTKPYMESMKNAIPYIKKAGWDEGLAQEVGCPYISHARATMTRKALDAKADVIVYIDYDISFAPEDLLQLLQTEGDVVAGTYRYKKREEEYMGAWHCDANGTPSLTPNGCFIDAYRVPAGFLKVTRNAIRKIMRAYPELVYGDPENASIDLFQHGAHKGIWYGEDMAFSRRWIEMREKLILIPELTLTHWGKNKKGDLVPYPGNLDEFLRNQLKKDKKNVKAV